MRKQMPPRRRLPGQRMCVGPRTWRGGGDIRKQRAVRVCDFLDPQEQQLFLSLFRLSFSVWDENMTIKQEFSTLI